MQIVGFKQELIGKKFYSIIAMQFEGVGLISKVKTYHFYINCCVVCLKPIAVMDHKLLTSGTNLVSLMKEIALNLNSVWSSHGSVV